MSEAWGHWDGSRQDEHSGGMKAEDLMTGQRFTLHGKGQWLRLDPGTSPFALWRLTPEDGTQT